MLVNSCCCCISVKIGAKILGFLSFIRFFALLYSVDFLLFILAVAPSASFLWMFLDDKKTSRKAYFFSYLGEAILSAVVQLARHFDFKA